MIQTDPQLRTLGARIERLEAENKRLNVENESLKIGKSAALGELDLFKAENDRFRKAILSKYNSLLRLVRQARAALYIECPSANDELIDAMNDALGDRIQDELGEE